MSRKLPAKVQDGHAIEEQNAEEQFEPWVSGDEKRAAKPIVSMPVQAPDAAPREHSKATAEYNGPRQRESDEPQKLEPVLREGDAKQESGEKTSCRKPAHPP